MQIIISLITRAPLICADVPLKMNNQSSQSFFPLYYHKIYNLQSSWCDFHTRGVRKLPRAQSENQHVCLTQLPHMHHKTSKEMTRNITKTIKFTLLYLKIFIISTLALTNALQFVQAIRKVLRQGYLSTYHGF